MASLRMRSTLRWSGGTLGTYSSHRRIAFPPTMAKYSPLSAISCEGTKSTTLRSPVDSRNRPVSSSRSDSLRACLKRSRLGCETPHHQMDHGDPDPRLGGCGQGLEVFAQPPCAIEPAEGAFDDPAPLHHLKTLGVPRAFHDHKGPSQHRRDPRDELA